MMDRNTVFVLILFLCWVENLHGKRNTVSIRSQSSGYNVGDNCSITINGTEHCPNLIGHNVVVVDPETNEITSRNFNTYWVEEDVHRLVNYLKSLKYYSIVVICVADAYAKEYFTSFHVTNLNNFIPKNSDCPIDIPWRSSWTLISQKMPPGEKIPKWAKCEYSADKSVIIKTDAAYNVAKLEVATQYGPSRLHYKCVFEIDQPSDVKWRVNGLNVDGYSEFFHVTNYYDVIDKRQISTMQIMHPSVAYNGHVDCAVPDHYLFYFNQAFPELTAGSEQYQNYKFPVTSESVTDSVEEICHLWNGRLYINTEEWQTHVGVDCTKIQCGCRYQALEIIELTSTMPIKPSPFIHLDVVDHTDKREDATYGFTIENVYKTRDNALKPPFYLQDGDFYDLERRHAMQPDTHYRVVLQHSAPPFHLHPKQFFFLENFKSSSLKPGTPFITNATFTSSNLCNIQVNFSRVNVEMKDTFVHFIPEVLVESSLGSKSTTDYIRYKSNPSVLHIHTREESNVRLSIRVKSTEERFHGDYSESVHCTPRNF